jgi:hypothetical protein
MGRGGRDGSVKGVKEPGEGKDEEESRVRMSSWRLSPLGTEPFKSLLATLFTHNTQYTMLMEVVSPVDFQIETFTKTLRDQGIHDWTKTRQDKTSSPWGTSKPVIFFGSGMSITKSDQSKRKTTHRSLADGNGQRVGKPVAGICELQWEQKGPLGNPFWESVFSRQS